MVNSMLQALSMYESARFDRRVFTQIAVTGAVGLAIIIWIGFIDNQPWGAGLFGAVFFGISAVSSYIAKQSNDAMKYWKSVYEDALSRDK